MLKVFEKGAAAANFGDGERDVGAGDGVDVGVVLAGLFAIEFGGEGL